MKNFIISMFMICPLWAMAWQSNPEIPLLTREFPAENIQVLSVQTIGISTHVNAWEENRVLVEVFAFRDNKPLDPEDSQLKKKLEDLRFDFREEGNQLILNVETEKKSGLLSGKDNIILLIKVQGPKILDSSFLTEGGSITLSGLQGSQEIQSKGGSIRAIDCEGKLMAESSGGSIYMNKFRGEMGLKAEGGSVRIEQFSGTLQANSSGGSMSLVDISGKTIAEANGAAIRASFIEPLEEISLSAKGGGIDMVLPKQSGMNIHFSGSIVVSQHQNFEGESKRSLVKGTINGGGIPVSASASGGNVKVDYY
jgi:hypothetical protein